MINHDFYTTERCIRGYHAYGRRWLPVVSEVTFICASMHTLIPILDLECNFSWSYFSQMALDFEKITLNKSLTKLTNHKTDNTLHV